MRGGARCSLRVVLGAGLLWFAGCASIPQASLERDAEAKQFVSHPATAALYVYRIDTAEDHPVLWIDGRLIGATLPYTFFRVDVEPGKHVLSGLASDNGRLALDTRPGEVYFVALAMTSGQSRFQQVPDGRKTLTNCCSLLENWAPGQRPLLR